VVLKLLTTIPVRNGARFIEQTLESLSRQTVRPDRIIVSDDCSTDRTGEIAKNFKGITCEVVRSQAPLGLFQNFNRCLELAEQYPTEYLQILHADDTIEPTFYETMIGLLADCDGFGMAWCLDERIDEESKFLSMSGKEDGRTEWLTRDEFLQLKAELRNQAFCATLLKLGGKPAPCRFPTDLQTIGDMAYWAAFGAHCKKIFHLHRALAKYRWHGGTQTVLATPNLKALILDEWRAMEMNEMLREKGWSAYRKLKLKALFSVRSNIKVKRSFQNGNVSYAGEIVRAARPISGMPLWLAGRLLVELRDIYLFKILGRRRHPNNIYG
jgi:glycosyltransferase involved in cell wall biosynthesis